MPFIEFGKYMRTLTKSAMKDTNCTIPMQWLENIYMKSTTYSKKLLNIISEYRRENGLDHNLQSSLTKKELNVLIDLCHGLSREEIALNQDLSVNTIKTMLENIYNKLGAVNAMDAVRIAVLNKLLK